MMIPGIPKTERVWLTGVSAKNEKYYITAKENRDCYFLYKEKDGRAVKMGKGKSPLELERKYV